MPKTQVEVESSGLDLMEAVADVVKAAKAGGAPAALEAAVAKLVGIVAAIQALPADAKEDLPELIKGAACGVVDVVVAAVK